MNSNRELGYSLIEMLVVIIIFAILSVVGTQIVTISIRNSNKSERQTEVRENVDYVFNVISRELQSAESLDTDTSTPTVLNYYNKDGVYSTIRCINGYIELGTARITSTSVEIQCSGTPPVFAWQAATSSTPYTVTVTLRANDTGALGIDGSEIETSRQIIVRSF